MHFASALGTARTSVAILRRRRGLPNGCVSLALLCRRTYRGSFSSLRCLAPTSPFESLFFIAAALVTSRRYEASSSQMAAAGTSPAVSASTRLRYRRGAHRKRGSAAGGDAALPPVPFGSSVAVDLAVPGVADPAVAVEAKVKKKTTRSVDVTSESTAEKKVAGNVKDNMGGAGKDTHAEAIITELAASSPLNRLNGHKSTATKTNNVSETASKSTPGENAEAAQAANNDIDDFVVGVELKRSRRSNRGRRAKRRRGSHDDDSSVIESSEVPAIASAKSLTKNTVEVRESTPTPSASPSKDTLAKTVQEAATTTHGSLHDASDGVSNASAEGATNVGREKKTRRRRKSNPAPSVPDLADQLVENVNLSGGNKDESTEENAAAAAAEFPLSSTPSDAPRRFISKRLRRGERGQTRVPVDATPSTSTTVKTEKGTYETQIHVIEQDDKAVVVESADEPSSTGAEGKKRAIKKRRLSAATEVSTVDAGSTTKLSSFSLLMSPRPTNAEGKTAPAAAAVATTTTESVSQAVASPLPTSSPEKVPKSNKQAATLGDEVEAAVNTASPEESVCTPAAVVPTVPSTANNSLKKKEAAANAKGKRQRGRKPKATVSAAAEPAKTTEVTTPFTTAPLSHTATSTVVAQPTPSAEVIDFPKSTAAALKKLFAASAHGSDGETPSLAAKKRLAAQIIRRRWQLQQESKGRKLTLPSQSPPRQQQQQEEVTAKFKAKIATVYTPQVSDDKVNFPFPTKGSEGPKRTKEHRRHLRRRIASSPLTATAAETVVETKESPAADIENKDVSVPETSVEQSNSTAAVLHEAKGHDSPTETEEAEEAARDAEVVAAIKAAIALAAMPEIEPLEGKEAVTAVAHHVPLTDNDREASSSSPSTATHQKSDNTTNATAVNRSGKAPRKLATLVARSQNVVTPVAARSARNNNNNSGGNNSGSGSDDKRQPSSGGGGGGGGKGINSKDTLYFPDYRERVVQIFEQMAEINSALGERYKSLSYANSVERLKRGDKVFQLLPPNLLPLPEDNPSWKAPAFDATTPESVITVAQRRAKEVEENRAKRKTVLSSENILPGVGHKLRLKIIEILETGDLKELHRLEGKPLIRAIRELTQVHGFGPRTAIEFFKKYNITSVKELQDYAVKKGELDMGNKETGRPAGLMTMSSNANRTGFHLNDAQRLGLVYYKDMSHRIPHDEGRLHEAFMKLRLRKYLGKDYELVVCGSYRRQVAASGDIDVLVTRKRELDGNAPGTPSKHLPPHEVLATFLNGLKTDRYIEATLAQGPTKFMGLCRLHALPPPARKTGGGMAAAPSLPRFRARRLDIRYVDANCFPAAMLYFTGSKNFNVIMRSEAIKKRCILNEYGLFRKFSRKQQLQRQVSGEKPFNLHEMITRLARFGFASIKEVLEGNSNPDSAAGEETDESATSTSVTSAAKKIKKKSKVKTREEIAELCEVAKIVEGQRVKAHTEREIFDALDMDYVQPKDRNV